jgi:hypothetical protein
MSPVRRPPPPKRAGHLTGRRRFDGELLDIAGVAVLLGISEKAARARIGRQLLPYRRLNGRIVLLRRELMEFLDKLPGVSVATALENVLRRGVER